MRQLHHLMILCILFLFSTPFTESEIHRAKTHGGKSTTFTAGEISNIGKGHDGSGSTVSVSTGYSGDEPGGHTGRENNNYAQAWVCSIVASLIVGMAGIFPLFLPIQEGPDLQKGAGAVRFKCLLSFAVGSLLGDVFLHLLPEAWAHIEPGDHQGHVKIGLWILCGIMTFLTLEKVFADDSSPSEYASQESKEIVEAQQRLVRRPINKATSPVSQKELLTNGFIQDRNGSSKTNGSISKQQKESTDTKHHRNGRQHSGKNGKLRKSDLEVKETEVERIKVTGYLNLLANIIDNFTHGLAVGGSFLVSFKCGALTTFAIMLHEIPHEIGDFVILLRSGFDRWKAAKAQVYTACGGLCGAMLALMSESAEKAGDNTAWILPFTSGGFLNIALVTVLPDLLEEPSPRESVKQVFCLLSGIGIMATVNLIVD